VTSLEWAEFAAAVVTALGLPIALASFWFRKRREFAQRQREAVATQARHDDIAFDSLHREYVELLKLQLMYPELDLGESALESPVSLTDTQLVQEAAMFNIFVSLIERAYRLYARTSDRARLLEWRGWEEYVDEQLERENFRRLWGRHSEQYDADFVATINHRLETRARQNTHDVTVEQVSATSAAAIQFVIAAGRDPAAFLNTFMPKEPDRRSAAAWLGEVEPWVFLVRKGPEPVGVIAAHRPHSPGVPDGFLETNTYLAAATRGQGVATEAWNQIETRLRPHAVGLAGVVWERNDGASRRMARSGYREADRVWYENPSAGGESGWCRVWLKDMT
jgi:hypothetical protein